KTISRCWDQLFHRTLTVAFTAGWLATSRRLGHADRAFTGGIFHDVGKTVALRSLCAMIMSGAVEPDIDEAVIDHVLEAVHLDLGTELHGTWNLPAYLIS